ncbi:MAG: hypothetical protein Q3990_05070 [Desulfovibrionaceae bacterium]|nr:hypothetical protein [Desulfovibrionaceae bacterium]
MARPDLSHKATFRKNYLNPAIEQKVIERTIPGSIASADRLSEARFPFIKIACAY